MRVGLGKVRLYSSHKDRDQKAEVGSLRCDHSLIAQRGRYNHVEAVVDDGFCRFACLVMGRLPSRVAQLAEEMECSENLHLTAAPVSIEGFHVKLHRHV